MQGTAVVDIYYKIYTFILIIILTDLNIITRAKSSRVLFKKIHTNTAHACVYNSLNTVIVCELKTGTTVLKHETQTQLAGSGAELIPC